MKKNGKYISCAFCGKKRYVQKHAIRKSNFCSPQCYNEYRKIHKPNQHLRKRIIKKCATCGIEMFIIPCRYERTKTCSRECLKKWKEKSDEHKHKVKLAINRRKRAKRKNIKENYTKEDAEITMKEFNNKCYNCGSTENLHIDHHRPFSKNNPLTLDNAVVLCQTCNQIKFTKMPEDFYPSKKLKKLEAKLNYIFNFYKERETK